MKTTGIQKLVDLICVISQKVISKLLKFVAMFSASSSSFEKRTSITIKAMNLNLCMWRSIITG